MTPEERFAALGLELPPAPTPMGVYKPGLIEGGYLYRHPFVINGCSELFARIWGPDRGVGVRSAVGMGSLPGNIPVEIESLFKLEDA